jgi:hypothetical protein
MPHAGLHFRTFLHHRKERSIDCRGRNVPEKRYNSDLHAISPSSGMKRFLPILVLVCSACLCARAQTPSATGQPPSDAAAPALTAPMDESARKAKALIQQAIQALGGDIYLGIKDREQQGKGYGFHHGRSSGAGTMFWSFTEFPDKERVELTQQRDITELYVANKGYEITFKGVKALDDKDMVDYLRRRKFSLDTILRTWVNDPGVVFLLQRNAIAAQHPSTQVTLINSKNESVTLFFDLETHLPVKKSFEWRDPVDKQKNLEEEIYDNYRPVSGTMMPYNVTRLFNGDMASQRFLSGVTINQGLDQTMFDPNSGYNPNKPTKKK